ncbi:DUF58 domain-containing protein [Agromyces humatus]|uniref:DUF58 domain-containing protein n=1 Tax=Agromyces humatus TaxID=279573 RepID=A0ABP4WKY3_9MICO|nr:DUF58 domain-containing protein [Agromyces humatus]
MRRPSFARVAAWPRLTRRGGALVLMGAVLVAVSLWFDLRDILLLAFVAIAMPVIAAVFVSLRPPRLAVFRTFTPATIAAGTSTWVALAVKNRSKRTFDGAHWRDRVPDGLAAPPDAVLPAIGPFERMLPSGDDTVHLEYRLRVSRRGVYVVGPLRVGLTDPFALARIDRDVGSARELIVTPRVTPLDAALGTAASVDGVLHGLQRRTHPNSDELIAREYRYGDPLRRVNWAATARRGELMVREEEQRGDPEARILLDTTLSARQRTRHEFDDHVHAGFELGIEVAASIGVHLLDLGYQVRCDAVADPARGGIASTNDGEYHMPGGDQGMLEDLARLDSPTQHDAPERRASTGGSSAPARAREARMPGFAVLVEPDEHDAANLVALRPGFEPAVAFVTESTSARVVDALEAADWRVVRVRRPTEIGGAWSGSAVRGPGPAASTGRISATAAARPPASTGRSNGHDGHVDES